MNCVKKAKKLFRLLRMLLLNCAHNALRPARPALEPAVIKVGFIIALALAIASPAFAAGTFSSFPDATLPLGSIPNEVPLDQGSGCPTRTQPCTTVRTTSSSFIASIVGNNPAVANTTALEATSTLTYPNGVWRLTDGVAGAQPLFFNPSGIACPLAAGAGDGASQVPSSNGQCWFGQLGSTADVGQWSTINIGSGSVTGTDSTPQMTAALAWCAALPSRSINLGIGRYAITSGSLTIARNCELQAAAAPNAENASSPINGFISVGGAILLGTGDTINLSGTMRNVSVFPYGLAEPTSFQNAVSTIAGWSGTAVTITGDNTNLFNTFILGFNTCYNATNAERPTIDHADFDCINNEVFNNIQDVGHISHVHSWPYYNGNTAFQMYSGTISGVANNGVGLIRLTVDTTTNFITGNTIQVRQVPFQSANGNWIITVIDGTHIDLQGSSFTPITQTATWGGSATTDVINVPSTTGIWYGETVSGTNIQGGTTVKTINFLNGDIYLSNATTGGGPQSVTFTSTAYTSGGTDTLNLATRNGTNRLVENSAQINFSDQFEFGWQIGYHNTTTSTNSNDWTIDVNTSCDQFDDPTIICRLVDGKSTLGEWIGGQGGGNALAYVNDTTIANTSDEVVGVQIRNSTSASLETPAVVIINPASPSYVKFDGFSSNSLGLPAYILPYANTGTYTISGTFQGSGIQLLYSDPVLVAGQATASASLAGTWTPGLNFGSPTGTPVTLTSATGHYSIDPFGIMTASFDVSGPTLGPTGITQITGLPLNCVSGLDNRAGTSGVSSANMTGLGTGGLFVWEPGGQRTMFSLGTTNNTGTTNILNTNFTSSSDVYGTFTCRTR